MSIYKWHCEDKEHALKGYSGIILCFVLLTVFMNG